MVDFFVNLQNNSINRIKFPQTINEWRTVFFIAAGLYSFGLIFCGLFASGEQQPWAQTSDQGKNKLQNQSSTGELSDLVENLNYKSLNCGFQIRLV